jgi:hypothetical protein
MDADTPQAETPGRQRVRRSERGLAGVAATRLAKVEPFKAGERVSKEEDVRVC